MIFLSSGVARKHRKARDDLIANFLFLRGLGERNDVRNLKLSLLLYEFSNLRYYKHSISDVLVY